MAGVLAVLGCACGNGSEGGQGRCEPKAASVLPEESQRPLQGKVSIRESRDVTLDEQGMPRDIHVGRVQAVFADLSTASTTVAEVLDLGGGCGGVVSRPQDEGVRFFEPTSFEVLDDSGDPISLRMTGPGKFFHSGEPFFDRSQSFKVVGKGDSLSAFADFDVGLPASVRIEPLGFKTDGTEVLNQGSWSVSWVPKEGDFVVLSIVPNETSSSIQSGGKVECIMADEGCFEVPELAVQFLLGSAAPDFTLVLKRHHYRAQELGTGGFLEVETLFEFRATLQNGERP